MKKILTTILLLGIIVYGYCSFINPVVSADGINFTDGTLTEAIRKAKSENKAVFIDVSTTWCGYCKKMKRNAFSDKTVGAYFNDKFVSIEMDAEKGEGIAFAQKYNVNSFPTFIILDKNETVVLIGVGYLDKEQFMEFGQTAFSKIK